MLEGYRQIVGDERFFELARTLLDEHGYGNISLEQFIDLALEISDFEGAELDRLDAYFRQWLLAQRRPMITPADF
jgi:aminopeptidase N